MRIYWSLRSVPELAAIPRDERQVAFDQALRRYRSRLTGTQRVVEVVALCVAGGLAAVFALFATSSALWGAVLGGVLGAAVGNHVRLSQARAELRSRRVAWDDMQRAPLLAPDTDGPGTRG